MQYLSIGGLPSIQQSLSEKFEREIILRSDLGFIVYSVFNVFVATNEANKYTRWTRWRSLASSLGAVEPKGAFARDVVN